mgnify:CR=1 FL=1
MYALHLLVNKDVFIFKVNFTGLSKGFIFIGTYSIPEISAFVSSVMTLEPGDLIATGTPAGVGRLASGDIVEVEVTGVGVLRNPVK